MSVKQIFGGNLKHFREMADLSVHELSQEMGVSVMTVYRWERGLCWPKDCLVDKLTRILNIQPENLFEQDQQAQAG